MDSLIFALLFSAFGVLYFILGWQASRLVTTDIDYYVAGRQLGIAQVTCNLIATQLGGGFLLGTAAFSYKAGWYGLLYAVGISIGFFLLGLGIAGRLQQFNVTTTAQLFEDRYNSIFLKKIASLLSIITLFGILVAQVVGFKSLLASVGFGNPWVSTLFWLSVVAYTMLGGLRAITINDMVQLALITIVFGSIFIYSLMQGGLASFADLFSSQKLFSEGMPSWTIIFSTICMPALFSLIEQDIAQRFFASRSRRVATLSALYAGAFLFIFAFIPVYFGMQVFINNICCSEGSNPLLVYLGAMTNDILFALALCAIVAAIISTADALLNGISANITQDFTLGVPGLSKLYSSKIITLLIGIAALIASYMVPLSIIDLIISSYALSVSCLLVPLLICYYKKAVFKEAAFCSVLGGLLFFGIGSFYSFAMPKEIIALVASLFGYAVGNWYAVRMR